MKRSAMLLLFFLSACSRGPHDLHQLTHDLQSTPKNLVTPLPQWSTMSNFEFPNLKNRRSPFSIQTSVQHKVLEEPTIDALQCVGCLKQGNRLWGLIKQADKQVISIQVGDVIGKARVLSIHEDAIELEEDLNTQRLLGKRVHLRSIRCKK